MKEVDYIVVGQGIAGSLLAWELCKKGYRVCIIDDGYKNSASIVAAGLINPITGLRLVKSWEVDQFLSFAKDYYRKLEEQMGVVLFKDREILRLFKNEEEVIQWEKRKNDEVYAEYIGERFEAGAWGDEVADHYGSFIIQGGGNLDTKLFLDIMRQRFEKMEILNEHAFNYEEVELNEKEVYYQGVRAKKILFCEGYKVIDNPWFGDLKWVPAKGEILTVKLDSILPDKVMNNGKWLMPIGNGHYRVGASYDCEHLDSLQTKEGRDEILTGFRAMLKIDDFEVVGHEAGVRSCTQDQKPYVGLHPEYECLGIFNGLGSKGILMAPYYARKMAGLL